MDHIDLFSGSGGFAYGLRLAGPDYFKTVAFCEISQRAIQILRNHWGPAIPIYGRIQDHAETIVRNHRGRVGIITGGDPCPVRSRAKGDNKTQHPDLSGYFLAVVAGVGPRWVVRENVPASDDIDFCAGLETLGYRTVVIRGDAETFTGQSRQRDFVVGCHQTAWECFSKFILQFEEGAGNFKTVLGERKVVSAFTAHAPGYTPHCNHVLEIPNWKLRVFDREEFEAFAGYPAGWLEGLSYNAYAKMCGLSVVPQVVEPIGHAIMETDFKK